MPDKIGPHLLGRLPFKADSRDFRLENFLHRASVDGTDADLATLAADELKKTTVSYPRWAATRYSDVTTTHWWKAFNALSQIAPAPPPPPPSGDVLWSDPEAVLDQGNYGTCVGNGCAQFLNTLPIDDKFTEGMGTSALDGGPYARAIYYEATVLDGSPDNPDAKGGGQQGATVRSGVVALKNRGRIGAYALTTALSTAETWLKSKGSIIVGSDWDNDMFNPNSAGFVRPTGGYAGGHCYLWDEITASGDYGFLNSWSDAWGVKGRFYMSKSDFQSLISNGGELWTAVELAL